MPESPPSAFISYAREDLRAARKLYNDLKRAGASPWLDRESLLPGQRWRVEIKQAIRESRYFLAVLSSNSVSRRGYVHKEVAEALEILGEFPESEIFIIPVRLDDCSPSHERLRDLHRVDMFPSWEDGFKKILRAIGVQPGGNGIPWDRIGIAAAVIVVVIALGVWLVPNAKDFLVAWLSETPTVAPTISPTHTTVISNATPTNIPFPSTATHTFTPSSTPTLELPTAAEMIGPTTPEPVEEPTVGPTEEPTPGPTVEPIAVAEAGQVWVSPIDGAEMVYVPAGEFNMGSNTGDPDERPQVRVYLDAFYIDKYEVTNAQFAQFLNEQGNQEEDGVPWLDIENKYCLISQTGEQHQPKSGYEKHPVIMVSWYGARAYCRWAGKRLPTEAEWEKAGRGTDGRTYPWGDGIDCDHAQYSECGGQTVPVGSKPKGASPYGALDMAGNVWEWVADWYDPDYYSQSLRRNPLGPDSGEYRVLRGGSWIHGQGLARCASRSGLVPGGRNNSGGFRCARDSQ